MEVLVAAILFFVGAAGLAYILVRKLPELRAVSEEQGKSVRELKNTARLWLQNQQASRYARSPELLLEKALSQARIASLRTEAKTGELLEKLRRRTKEKQSSVESQNGNGSYGDGYWKQVREQEELKQP